MSPASYLTAPPRVAAGIVAPRRRAATIRGVSNWVDYGTLIVSVIAVGTAIGVLVYRILDVWRAFGNLRRGLGRELNRLADLGEVTVEKSAVASDTARLEGTLARLRVTLARFAVLRSAVDEVEDLFGRLTVVFPRK